MKNPKLIKLKEAIIKNIPLKILSLLLAFVAWIVIVNVSDPSQRNTVSGIPVSMENEDVLTNKGYIYQVESGSTVSIVVKGPQTIVENLKASDFIAYADLSERTPESDKARIYVSCINEEIANKIDIISQKSEYVQLSIDNKVDKDLPVQIEITGTPAEGYVVGNYGVSPTTIKISGAENTVKKISSVYVYYDVGSTTADVQDTVKPVFYDSDGKVVNADKLELSRSSLQIQIEILPTKWISVNYIITGDPAEGYAMTKSNANITSVRIAAKKTDLDKISGIDIPSGVVDITGAKADKTMSVNLGTYLPPGYTIVSSISELKVEASIEKVSDVIINIPVEDISITGLGNNYLYEINTGTSGNVLQVGVKGLDTVVKTLSSKDLNPTVSLLDKKTGVYTVKVIMDSGEEYTIPSTYYVKVTITEKQPDKEEESTEENPTETTEQNTQESSEAEDITE